MHLSDKATADVIRELKNSPLLRLANMQCQKTLCVIESGDKSHTICHFHFQTLIPPAVDGRCIHCAIPNSRGLYVRE